MLPASRPPRGCHRGGEPLRGRRAPARGRTPLSAADQRRGGAGVGRERGTAGSILATIFLQEDWPVACGCGHVHACLQRLPRVKGHGVVVHVALCGRDEAADPSCSRKALALLLVREVEQHRGGPAHGRGFANERLAAPVHRTGTSCGSNLQSTSVFSSEHSPVKFSPSVSSAPSPRSSCAAGLTGSASPFASGAERARSSSQLSARTISTASEQRRRSSVARKMSTRR